MEPFVVTNAMRDVRIIVVLLLTSGVMPLAVPGQDRTPLFAPPPIANGSGSAINSFTPEDVAAANLRNPEPSNPTERPLVVDVIVQGTTNEERARSYIRTKREYEFDPQALQADVRRLIGSEQYQNVKTYTRNVQEGVVVIFELSERTRIQQILFHGNRGFTDKKLLKTCELKQGEPLNAYDVEEGRRRIEEMYQSKGYPNAQIGILEGDKATDRSVVYLVNEGYLQRIESVIFEGNTFATDGVLKTKIQSKPGYLWYILHGKFNRQQLDSDVEKLTAYYHDFGYFRARVGREITVDESGRWAEIKFVVDEGQRYNVRNVSIVGNDKFHSAPLLDSLTLKNSMPFSRGEMQKDVNLLRDLYGSQGHIFTNVEPNPRFLEEPGKIDLVYKIEEGEPFRVGQINVHIAGEFPHTRRNVVLNRLSLRPGDLIDMRQVRDSERRLKFSQLFETEQTGGEPPRIAIRPPELADTAIAAGGNAKGPRGQSPQPVTFTVPAANEPYHLPSPIYDLDIFLPALQEDTQALISRLPPVDEEL